METQSFSSSPYAGIGKAILVAGFIAGTLDISTAMIVYHFPAEPMGRHIASGAVGREAAQAGGMGMVVLGFFFHYFIAYSWTTLFFLLYPKVSILQKNKYVVGLLYGIVVWIVMNRIVLPMTMIKRASTFSWSAAALGAAILMVMIGLPVSLLANRFYSRKQTARAMS
jgi:hypothetical protein